MKANVNYIRNSPALPNSSVEILISTQRDVAFSRDVAFPRVETWHFHEKKRGISTRRNVAFTRDVVVVTGETHEISHVRMISNSQQLQSSKNQ